MPCFHPIRVRSTIADPVGVVVPCGKCDYCLISRTREWAVRCELEGRGHRFKCFVTLTYSDENLIYGLRHPTLYPEHLKNFWKRLRKEYGDGIKYFACGEYGSRTYRPHYHAIIFGVDFSDKIPSGSRMGNQYYTSDTLNCLWTYGNCIIGDATAASSAYIARYILGKKEREKEGLYEALGIEPEFVRMSRRPGIGAKWLEKHLYDVYPWGNIITDGNVKNKIPRYFDKILSRIDEDELLGQKLDRKTISNKLYKNSNQLLTLEKIKKSQIKTLTRTIL